MADEADRAQAACDDHLDDALRAHRSRDRTIGICEECETEPCFVTSLGTVSRICRNCYVERRG